MSDIVLYTSLTTLNHKKGGDGFETYFWTFGRMPKNIDVGDRIFFAVKGYIVGSFEIYYIWRDANQVEWKKDSWKSLKDPIPTNPFRGFRYRWWDNE